MNRTEPGFEPLPPGTTLLDGAITLRQVLGCGGSGITYEAVELRTAQQIAVKEFYPAWSRRSGATVVPDPSWTEGMWNRSIRRFLQEAGVLEGCSHPGVRRIFAAFQANGTAYMTMEYLDGHTLAERVPVPPARALEVAHAIGDALDHVHRAGIVHRDVNPANVMQCAGRIVLFDFGSARSVEGPLQSCSAVLTPGFAPPEQYRGESEKAATDVYGLCATLYYLLTGTPPLAARQRELGKTFPDLRQSCPQLSGQVADAIHAGLSLQAAHRPQTVRALLERLGCPLPAWKNDPFPAPSLEAEPEDKTCAAESPHPQSPSTGLADTHVRRGWKPGVP